MLKQQGKSHVLYKIYNFDPQRKGIMKRENIIFCKETRKELKAVFELFNAREIFVLMDETTEKHCYPRIKEIIPEALPIVIPFGDESKCLSTLVTVWDTLQKYGATRNSLLLNVGGGMVTDLGGFAAATFKRGIPFVNLPTTLLAMVDAAIGGKTAINFGDVKNLIGAFYPAKAVLIDPSFLQTLDLPNLLSGYAEMLKHGLLSDEMHWRSLLSVDWEQKDVYALLPLVKRSISIKTEVVEKDPLETGIRQALNLGHTIGHSIESWALCRHLPVLHGYAVAWGLIAELYLSYTKAGFPKDKLLSTVNYIRENYGKPAFSCKDYEALYAFMLQDKKNVSATEVRFTLLSDIGEIRTGETFSKEEIFEALDFLIEI